MAVKYAHHKVKKSCMDLHQLLSILFKGGVVNGSGHFTNDISK